MAKYDVRIQMTILDEKKLLIKGQVRQQPFDWRKFQVKLDPVDPKKVAFYMEMTSERLRQSFQTPVLDYLKQCHPLLILAAVGKEEVRMNPPRWFTERYPGIAWGSEEQCTLLEADRQS